MRRLESIEELFTADEGSTYASGLSMDDISMDGAIEIDEYLESFSLKDVEVQKKGEDSAILSHPKFNYKVQVFLTPVGHSDTFDVSLKRLS